MLAFFLVKEVNVNYFLVYFSLFYNDSFSNCTSLVPLPGELSVSTSSVDIIEGRNDMRESELISNIDISEIK